MQRKLVLPGDEFGDLTVMAVYNPVKDRGAKCVVACRCGVVTTKWKHNLTSGHTLSCGCLQKRVTSEQFTTHGHTKGGKWTPTYTSWSKMWDRVSDNRNHPEYAHVRCCERWVKFENFLEDMGEAPPNHTIDRIKSEGNYEPGNCRWLPGSRQSANRRPWKHSDESLAKMHLNFKGN